jgi:hypothetical protein
MQDAPTDFAELISLWPSMNLLARDIGLPTETVAAWKRRNSIPYKSWRVVIASAQKNGIPGITDETFLRIIP